MKKLLLLVVLLAGCDGVVSSTPYGEPVVAKRLGDCHKSGFCYTCMPGFDGEFKCGMKFSSLCDGERNETVSIQRYKVKYESGKTAEHEDVTVLEAGECR